MPGIPAGPRVPACEVGHMRSGGRPAGWPAAGSELLSLRADLEGGGDEHGLELAVREGGRQPGAVPRACREETFSSQGDAESWLGENWRELLAGGVDQVTLLEEGRVEYGPMSLHPDAAGLSRRPGCPARLSGTGGLWVRAGSRWMTGPSTSSIRLSRSWSSCTPDALTFSRTCSGRVAPMIAADTFGFCSTQATASWAMLSPALRGERPQLLRPGVSTSSFSSRWMNPDAARVGGPGPGGRRLPRLVLAGQHALGDRRPDDLADAFLLAERARPRPRSPARACCTAAGWRSAGRSPSRRRCAARRAISSARHSETPMYSTLPWRTRSSKARMVSSSGVSWS